MAFRVASQNVDEGFEVADDVIGRPVCGHAAELRLVGGLYFERLAGYVGSGASARVGAELVAGSVPHHRPVRVRVVRDEGILQDPDDGRTVQTGRGPFFRCHLECFFDARDRSARRDVSITDPTGALDGVVDEPTNKDWWDACRLRRHRDPRVRVEAAVEIEPRFVPCESQHLDYFGKPPRARRDTDPKLTKL